jgi:hypothetical protein
MSYDRQTSTKAAIEHAVRKMNPELRQQYDQARRLLATTTASDARSRYKVGTIVLEIKRSEDRYGTRAVATLAAALGRNETTLYRYSAVAEAWSEMELEEILLKRMPGGEPLSWCHLQELASVGALDKRARLMNEALVKGLSHRELCALAHGTSATTLPVRPLGAPLTRLKRLAVACDRFERLAVDDATIERALAATPERAGEIVGRALEAQTRALEVLERNITALKKAAAALPTPSERAPDAGPAPAARPFYPRLLAGGMPS